MKKDSIIDFIVRNRYVILLITIVLILAFTGVIGKLMEIIFTALLIVGAIYLGKRIQEDDEFISHIFRRNNENVTYTVKDEDKE